VGSVPLSDKLAPLFQFVNTRMYDQIPCPDQLQIVDYFLPLEKLNSVVAHFDK
jgi:hypothetical protein